ncbi:curli assembly protein CsgF [Oxalobacteraceae bacterium OM1]|nr:curli assembly protein CsgF [Oxalobacteraceae bacterium OM1]
MRPVRSLRHAFLIATSALCAHASASELVYVPANPSFGGNPLNGGVFLNAAQAQNKTKDPEAAAAAKSTQQSSLQQFNDILERSVLSRLATAATSGIMGSNGQLVPGVVNTGNFTIQISDLGGGLLQVTTTDKATGASTSFQVGQQ